MKRRINKFCRNSRKLVPKTLESVARQLVHSEHGDKSEKSVM